jgi:predicted enzyme related to lactoylglutathione lyase
MEGNPIRWFEIYVQDMARAKVFYEGVFQVTLSKLNSTVPELWAFPSAVTSHGASGALAKMEGKGSGNGGTIVYFASADCSVEAARAVELGGRVLKEKSPIGPHGFIALIFDTEGNLFGLHSME